MQRGGDSGDSCFYRMGSRSERGRKGVVGVHEESRPWALGITVITRVLIHFSARALTWTPAQPRESASEEGEE